MTSEEFLPNPQPREIPGEAFVRPLDLSQNARLGPADADMGSHGPVDHPKKWPTFWASARIRP